MSYLLNRIKSTIRHLVSTRGVLLLAASVAAILALLVSGAWSRFLGIVAVASLELLILLIKSTSGSGSHTARTAPAGTEEAPENAT